jgi:aromatic ring hydroxylase
VVFEEGLSGLIPTLILASNHCVEHANSCMKIAEHLGEITWKNGLSKTDNSLGTGISGNGYGLHCLYRNFKRLHREAFNEEYKKKFVKHVEKWRTRTMMFAHALTDPRVHQEDSKTPENLSNLAGEIAFMSDVLRDGDS